MLSRRHFLGFSLVAAAALVGCGGTNENQRAADSVASVTTPAAGVFRVEPAWTQSGGGGTIETLAWQPGQQQFVSGSASGRIRFWSPDGTGGQVQQTPVGFVSGLAWTPDGKMLAVSGNRGSVHFWPEGASWSGDLTTIANRFTAVAWCPDGTALAVAGGEGAVKLLANDQSAAQSLALSGQTTALAWSNDGTLLAGGNRGGDVVVWSRDGATRWKVSSPSRHDVNALGWPPDSRMLAVGYEDGTVGLLDARTGTARPPCKRGSPSTPSPGRRTAPCWRSRLCASA